MQTYELWDFASGNRLGEYADRESALIFIKEDIEQGKAHLWHSGALLAFDERDTEELIAEGDALIALALASPPPRRTSAESSSADAGVADPLSIGGTRRAASA